MCFLLYAGSSIALPHIPWNEEMRSVHTAHLTDHDKAVTNQFSLPFVTYVGSDLQCGCGFRNAEFANGNLTAYEFYGKVPDEDIAKQLNHDKLHALLSRLPTNADLELFGCWDGDFAQPAEKSEKLPLSEILDQTFYFRDRYLYRVTLNP
ncbi:MAG: hypothetical protein KF688_13810 [Pirellulales bacterium]|nr:hypothetical protein [Pirellulales bacterium]